MSPLLSYLFRLLVATCGQAVKSFLRRLTMMLAQTLNVSTGTLRCPLSATARANLWKAIWSDRRSAAFDFSKPLVSRGTQINLPGSSPFRDQHMPFHALIIGIDGYESPRIVPLRGGASDADAIDEYVRRELRVPGPQIVNLRNQSATRSTILRELRALATNEAIRTNDAILIFFAGHGAYGQPTPEWGTIGDMMSLIVPYDCYGKDEKGEPVFPIPDRTIGGLLHEIAGDGTTGKGNNITVILDCCHSGSGTRTLEYAPMCLERGFEMDGDFMLPHSLDEAIWSELPQYRALNVASGFAMYGLSSHVLLAACKENEKALEENGRGRFTSALLHTLRQVSIDKITYKDLMWRITQNITGQTPQCEGRYIDRVLFNALVYSQPPVVYTVQKNEGELFVDAGSAHGVTSGAQFSIYSTRDFSAKETPLATMIATLVYDFRTRLSFASSGASVALPNTCFASQTFIGQAHALRLLVPQSTDADSTFGALHEELTHADYPVILREDERQVDLSLHEREGRVGYIIINTLARSFGLRELYQTTKPETRFIHPILRAATHFFSHFNRSPVQSSLRARLRVQVHELRADEDTPRDADLRAPYKTYGDNLNRLDAGIVTVAADDMTAYGVTMESDLNRPLHVWAFYFDCRDLSISEYYFPPACGVNGDPALPPRGKLAIGYGTGGGKPYTYYLRPGQREDVGFIKFFVSTQPVDLSYIEQRSPFGATERVIREAVDNSRLGLTSDAWDTVMIAVVQRKP